MKNLKKLWDKIKSLYGFLTHEDELFVYASSLSFYTIFAFIPLLLIVLSALFLLPDFRGVFEELKGFILSNIVPTHSDLVLNFLESLLQNSSKMGIIGLVYILFTSIMFFRNYEYITSKVFNSKPREFFSSISLYWTLISLFPLCLGISFYFVLELHSYWASSRFLSLIGSLTPILFGWIVFLLLFKISANKEIAKRSLLLSSFLTSVKWNIAKWVFVYYATYNQSYVSLYGSLSFILFLMLWIYISWFIVLLGMRICEGINLTNRS